MEIIVEDVVFKKEVNVGDVIFNRPSEQHYLVSQCSIGSYCLQNINGTYRTAIYTNMENLRKHVSEMSCDHYPQGEYEFVLRKRGK